MMKRYIYNFLSTVVILGLFLIPNLIFAQNTPPPSTLIVCDGADGDKCEYDDFIDLIKVVITALVELATLFAVITIIYAGYKFLTAGGNENTINDSKSMLWKVLIGYGVILVAWLLVYTLMNVLLNPGYSILGQPN